MKQITKFVMAAAAAGMVASVPSGVLAEGSQVPTPGTFPGIIVDAQAAGTKVIGFVTMSFDVEFNTPFANQTCGNPDPNEFVAGKFVRNLYVVASFQKGNTIKHYSSDYKHAGLPGLAGCLQHEANQISFLHDYMLKQVVIPEFFACSGSCPPFALKRVSSVSSTISTTNANVGNRDSYVFELELAVKE